MNSSPSRHFMSVTVKLRSGRSRQMTPDADGASSSATDVVFARFRSRRRAWRSLVTRISAGAFAPP
ncbi:MAG TPA: hypothetical protein VFO67_08260 [Gemmatimonadales bacterium]|nr:hypothetical protein [Gemmatimonadales bacterium]